jgi:hypothetical protein
MGRGKAVDLTGKTFGRLLVVKRSHSGKRGVYWECTCKCGNKKISCTEDLKKGIIPSCGCALSERARRFLAPKGSAALISHGLTHHPLYSVLYAMIDRCENIEVQEWWNYGGRGIKVCNEWHDIKNFHKWSIENGYKKGLTIDRIDNDGNYEPRNCRWITRSENSKRKKHYLRKCRKVPIEIQYSDSLNQLVSEYALLPSGRYVVVTDKEKVLLFDKEGKNHDSILLFRKE